MAIIQGKRVFDELEFKSSEREIISENKSCSKSC